MAPEGLAVWRWSTVRRSEGRWSTIVPSAAERMKHPPGGDVDAGLGVRHLFGEALAGYGPGVDGDVDEDEVEGGQVGLVGA